MMTNPQHFGIDYDDTFSSDPALWSDFIRIAESRGHRCYIVTCRRDTPENRDDIIPQTGLPHYRHIFTGLSAKRWACEQRSISIDVWIDDDPKCIDQGK